ncbi:MAG: hypothetical protein ACOCV8_02450, partial [Spirochaetota bacterium]
MKRIKSLTLIIVLMFVLLLFSFCGPTSLQDLNIDSIKLFLTEIDKNGSVIDEDVDTVKPGARYSVRADIYTVEGQKVEDPNLGDLKISSPNSSLTEVSGESTDSRTLILEATMDSYIFVKDPGSKFEALVKVEYNPYDGNSETWDVDWTYETLDFSGGPGSSGRDGYNGSDGRDGTEDSPDGEDGTPGSEGTDGSNGEDGEDLNFDIAYYDVSGLDISGLDSGVSKMIILYNKTKGYTSMFKTGTTPIIDVSGGDGGNGGDGGHGGDGGDGYDYEDPEETDGRGGNGGDGGHASNGGIGGTGGSINISCPTGFSTGVIDNIESNAVISGGFGGSAGQAGKGGTGGKGNPKGNDGNDGTPA